MIKSFSGKSLCTAIGSQTIWRVIKDTRNFYVHAYGAIDLPSVWDTLNHDIPALCDACEAILSA